MSRAYELEQKVFSYMEEHNMVKAGDSIVVGVSGGADSLCLLFMLSKFSKDKNISLRVVHINHGIRLEASKEAEYVEEICEKLHIPFNLVESDVRKFAEDNKLSEEEAGRIKRYEAFREAALPVNGKIAVAHNLNDRSETMLFNLFRGSDIRGLGSIRPVNGNIIRPLLVLTREEIEEYMSDIGTAFCTDSTNLTDDYSRNKIRHNILEYAEENIIHGAVKNIARGAEVLDSINDYLDEVTRTESEKVTTEKGIDIEKVLLLHPVIRGRILYSALVSAAGRAKDVEEVHVKVIENLMRLSGNHRADLPYSIVAVKEYGFLRFEKKTLLEEFAKPTGEFEYRFEPQKVFKLGSGEEIGFRIIETGGPVRNFPTDAYTKWLDCDKIRQPIVVRTRRDSDYMTIRDGQGNTVHKSLSDYMITEKIPPSERDRICLVAEGSHVLWLVGYRISEYYKTGPDTRKVLEINYLHF
ncbi:MAG: tRNA lysidine(34) synthetase TilS [Lachnospiraceae bacterium]|nr:tRNA lysidine(34) synthetase TilS [Lachnospiraceae bacterium]